MFSHAILDALFNEEASDPSKQLRQVRTRFQESTLDRPCILIILPPVISISSEIELQSLYHDYYLLSHVLDLSHVADADTFDTLNGAQWQIKLTKTQVIPAKGFLPNSSREVNIINSYLWSPGLASLPYNACFYVIETDGLMISNDAPKRFTWFNNSRSTPQFTGRESSLPPEQDHQEATDEHGNASAGSIKKTRLRNPASDLGRTKAQREQNMAKVDYCLACLQHDVISSKELAERFHRAVTAVRSTLIEAGGLYVDSTNLELTNDDEDSIDDDTFLPESVQGTAFSLASIYEYAEARLGKHLLQQLKDLLAVERKGIRSFRDLHKELKYLDLAQVDIPNLESLDAPAFEHAVSEAALILDRLGNARNSREMCNVFLAALKRLANRSLGTVSADTLLGLFMLTVLRISDATADILELDLYFVTHFSFQASDTLAMKASAGRVSYTLMVVESVLLQLRMEHERLANLAQCNKSLWYAVRGDEREEIKKIAEQSISSMSARRSGKSALFMAAEDHNSSLFEFLITTFPQIYTKEFVLKDRDSKRRTLLMVANEFTCFFLLDLINGVDPGVNIATSPEKLENDEKLYRFYNARDVYGRSLAFYLLPSKLTDIIGPKVNWDIKDTSYNTPILHHALVRPKEMLSYVRFCRNFFAHIDSAGNSLLHFAARNDNVALAHEILKLESCDVDWVNKVGETPLMLAHSEAMISCLLENGADPWLGNLDTDKSPSIRYARLSGKLPYVVKNNSREDASLRVFRSPDSDISVLKSPIDFVELESQLQSLSPSSWIPPLSYSYPEQYEEKGGFESRFAYQFTELEMQRLSFWLRQLVSHATFENMPELTTFFKTNTDVALDDRKKEADCINGSPIPDSDNVQETDIPANRDRVSTSLFSREDESSMLAFLQLGTERLQEVQVGLEDVIRHFSRIHSLDVQEGHANAKLNMNLQRLAMELGTRFDSADSRVDARPSLTTVVNISMLDQIVKCAQDLREKLHSLLEVAQKLENARSQISADRNRLRLLAEGKLKVSWIGNIEEKRVAEIKNLESSISKCRAEISSLELEIRAAHYFLANELSSFNKSQEEEILRQVEAYSKFQLGKARIGLRKLKFGDSMK